jgi:phospholipase/carboxylesterase
MTSSSKPTSVVIDGIECLTITRAEAQKTVIMLHGFGADMNDLAPLHNYLDPEQRFNWIFPNGIQTVPLGPHVTGRAWFPIRMADIEAAAMRGEVVDFADVFPEGMESAELRLKSLFSHLRIEPKNLILGGFSQGAMMACQVALTLQDDIAAMLLFSGNCINFKVWQDLAAKHKAIPYFQTHGTDDPVLGFKHAERLHQMLSKAGLKGHFIPFRGFHEIPLPIVREAAKFLAQI